MFNILYDLTVIVHNFVVVYKDIWKYFKNSGIHVRYMYNGMNFIKTHKY